MARRFLIRAIGMAALVLALAACSTSAMKLAPASATTPYRGEAGTAATMPGNADFGVKPDPSMPITIATPRLAANRTYDLPELINIAQLSNPATQAAWQRAREAAAATGIAEAAYLPIIRADVLAGYAVTSNTAPGSIRRWSRSPMGRSLPRERRLCQPSRSNGCCLILVREMPRWKRHSNCRLPPMWALTAPIRN